MSSLTNIYEKSIEENKRNLLFWEDYLKSLKSLDFNVYSEKLTVPILVPTGSRIMFRGHLKHTNEVTVVLGADYFAKCSIKQAEVLRQHRIKDAESKVDMYNKEKEYLEKQISFSKDNVYETQGQEIIESYTEEEDKAWRERHRENLRKYKQEMKNKNEEQITEEYMSDEDLWTRLEELELQEELESELQELNEIQNSNSDMDIESFLIKGNVSVNQEANLETKEDRISSDTKSNNSNIVNEVITQQNVEIESQEILTNKSQLETSNLDIIHQVMDRQKELECKLYELKNRERSQCKNENDLIAKLDELEQLDEVEDELERLDDLLENEDTEDEEENSISQSSATERRVSFADKDDSRTLELVFKHADVEPDLTPYDHNKGLQKPSDIYEIHANLFRGSTSILKKSKYKEEDLDQLSKPEDVDVPQCRTNLSKTDILQSDSKNSNRNKTIVVRDVTERANEDDSKIVTESRPKSIFKKMRMQSKS